MPSTEAVQRVFQQAIALHMYKSMDYGEGEAEFLGPAGQFAEIYRKIPKLKRSMWEGKTLNGEQPAEILMDLMAHCALAVSMLGVDSQTDARIQEALAAIMGSEADRG